MTIDNLLTQHISDHHCVLVSRSLWPQLLQCDPVPNNVSIPERNSRTWRIVVIQAGSCEWNSQSGCGVGWGGVGWGFLDGCMSQLLWRFRTEGTQLIFCATHVFAVLPFVHGRKNPHWLSRLQILLSYTDTVLQFCFLSLYQFRVLLNLFFTLNCLC